MIVRYTNKEFENAKSDDLLQLECEHCGKVFYVKKNRIKYELKHNRGRLKYCSIKCSDTHHKKKHITNCSQCGKEIEIRNVDYNRSKSKQFFCSHSCAAKYNNIANYKKSKPQEKNGNCNPLNGSFVYQFSDEIFKKIVLESVSYNDITRKLGYSSTNSVANKIIVKRCKELGIEIPFKKSNVKGEREIKNMTKGELKKNRGSYQSYRSSIRKDAEKTFKQNEKSCYRCIICGYDKHIEIAHIKAVSDFADESLISEINHINNIIPLCPNHHWEYDNNAMNENEKRIIEKYMKT